MQSDHLAIPRMSIADWTSLPFTSPAVAVQACNTEGQALCQLISLPHHNKSIQAEIVRDVYISLPGSLNCQLWSCLEVL